jgi:hypothetical protein
MAAAAPGLTNEMQIFQLPIHDNWQIDLKKFATFIAKQYYFKLVLMMSSPNAFLSNILQIQSATCGTMMLLLSWVG